MHGAEFTKVSITYKDSVIEASMYLKRSGFS